jgi:hypothetical protein
MLRRVIRTSGPGPKGAALAVAVLAAPVLSVAALGGCSGGSGRRAEVAAPPVAARPTIFPVVDTPPAQVHRVAVEGQGKSAALVRTSSATWLAEPGTPETAIGLIAQTEDEILPLQAYRRLDADPHGAEFGLADPGLVVHIQNGAGEEQVVAVGGTTFSGAGSYARRDGDAGHVYLLVRRSVDDLRSLLEGERVNTPRSQEEQKASQESPEDADPEDVTNPWLAQTLEETKP